MDIPALIHKVISGNASEIEKTDLNKWIDSDPANKLEFDNIRLLMEGARDANNINRSDSFYNGLQKIKSTIKTLKARDRKIKFYKVLCVVLVIVILIFIVAFYMMDGHQYSKNQTPTSVKGVDSMGRNKILMASVKFEDVALREVFISLENHYGIIIKIKSEHLLSCKFTGTFYQGVTIEDIMHSLSRSVGFEYTALDVGTYEVHGKGCDG